MSGGLEAPPASSVLFSRSTVQEEDCLLERTNFHLYSPHSWRVEAGGWRGPSARLRDYGPSRLHLGRSGGEEGIRMNEFTPSSLLRLLIHSFIHSFICFSLRSFIS
eukprot:GHVU01026524.1.p1 GENE.GHVU01026524.1~~GHVU01026524.1.p1  ORF type:complete len:106 (-),score=4.95 GHVU01026524.1:28-345(-)